MIAERATVLPSLVPALRPASATRFRNRAWGLGVLLALGALVPCSPVEHSPAAFSVGGEVAFALRREGRRLTECHYDYRLSRTQVRMGFVGDQRIGRGRRQRGRRDL